MFRLVKDLPCALEVASVNSLNFHVKSPSNAYHPDYAFMVPTLAKDARVGYPSLVVARKKSHSSAAG